MHGEFLDRLLSEALAARSAAGHRRVRRRVEPAGAGHILIDGRRLVDFASNNYLGLTHHPAVVRAVQAAAEKWGVGAGASPLITGHSPAHAEAERALAAWKGHEGAVLVPSGYQGAHAIIQALRGAAGGKPGAVQFFVDRLLHASWLDALAAGDDYRTFPHNDLAKLRRLIETVERDRLVVVITESIFSMDGDAADLGGLAQLKEDAPFVLVLDEAHGTGVYGPEGRGYAAERGLGNIAEISLVTLSKAVGLAGAAVCGSGALTDALVNWGRAEVYSTALPPTIAAGAMAAIEVMRAEPQRQERVRHSARLLRESIRKTGSLDPLGLPDSPIIPVVLGSEEAAMAAALACEEQGLFVAAIRPPSVPRGTSRLRITVSCEHTDEQIETLSRALGRACGSKNAL